jgi:hypothetical protein
VQNYSASYKVLKTLDPFHPAIGALNCPRSWEFFDGPGGRSNAAGDHAAELVFDVAMHENYDLSFPGHIGKGPRAPIEQVNGDAPLRYYPTEYEPLVNCPYGESTQYFLYTPKVEDGPDMTGVPAAGIARQPMSPNGLRGIGWIGTIYDMNDVLWYTYNALGSGSPTPRERLGLAASQFAFEMQELYPSLTAIKDGSLPRALVTVVTSPAHRQSWVKSKAWLEPQAPGTTGGVSTGDWNPITGIEAGTCRPLGQTQTVGTPCTTSAVCVHVLVANTAVDSVMAAVHVKAVDRFGQNTGNLSGTILASLPFESFESNEAVPVHDGVFIANVPAFSVRMYRLGCAPPPTVIGNLVPNPSFEDVTITGAVASWGFFAQNEARDVRNMIFSDTMYSQHGRHSMKLQLPKLKSGAIVGYKGALAIPFSLGGAIGNCGEGHQGFMLQSGFAYNISIWARSDDPGMNVSIASGRWVPSFVSKFWEYIGQPHATLSPLTAVWTKLEWQHVSNMSECLQLLFAGQGQINIDNTFLGKTKVGV